MRRKTRGRMPRLTIIQTPFSRKHWMKSGRRIRRKRDEVSVAGFMKLLVQSRGKHLQGCDPCVTPLLPRSLLFRAFLDISRVKCVSGSMTFTGNEDGWKGNTWTRWSRRKPFFFFDETNWLFHTQRMRGKTFSYFFPSLHEPFKTVPFALSFKKVTSEVS